MDESSTSKALKQLSRKKLDKESMDGFLAEILGDSHRTVAITMGAFVEDGLKALLVKHMPQLGSDEARLFGPDAPIGTFSAKIRLGYALGLFSKDIRDDLDRIREIRNAFAHTMSSITFETKEVRDVSFLLKAFKELARMATAKEKFVLSCMALHGQFRYGSPSVLWIPEPETSPQKSK